MLLYTSACFASVPQFQYHYNSIPKQHRVFVANPKGHWVMSDTGHAVWCTGPSVILGGFNGHFSYFATGCTGRQGSVVRLHD